MLKNWGVIYSSKSSDTSPQEVGFTFCSKFLIENIFYNVRKIFLLNRKHAFSNHWNKEKMIYSKPCVCVCFFFFFFFAYFTFWTFQDLESSQDLKLEIRLTRTSALNQKLKREIKKFSCVATDIILTWLFLPFFAWVY